MAETVEEYKARIARAGGLGRASKLTAEEKRKTAKKAAKARWKGHKKKAKGSA